MTRRTAILAACLGAAAVGAAAWALSNSRALSYPRLTVPADNPVSDDKATLGRWLFYDRRLSVNASVACATCHRQAFAFSDPRARSIGATGQPTTRNAMTLTNVAYNGRYTWADNRLKTLEQQALVPLTSRHPLEMGILEDEAGVLARLRGDARYAALFRAAFPREADAVSLQNVVRAISTFVRTLVSFDSPYDRFLRGHTAALTDSARRGFELFRSDQFKCGRCHGGINFRMTAGHRTSKDDESVAYHNTGLYNVDGQGAYPAEDHGLFDVTHNLEDMGRFKAPTLRNVAVTAPYMHDGSIATLEAVLEHYAAGGRVIGSGPTAGDGRRNPHKSALVTGFVLTPADKRDLLAFLESLTDRTLLNNPAFGDPFPDADVVASRTAMIDTPHGRTALILDLDPGDSQRAEIDQLLADPAVAMTVISAPAGPSWRRLRDLAPPRVQIALIDACAGGRTAACTREVGPFIEALRNAPASAPTGAIIEDQIAGSTPAPAAVVVPTGQFQTNVTDASDDWMERWAGRPVRLLRPIAVARTETTVAQFRRFVDASGYRPGTGCLHHTVQQVWEPHEDADWTKPVFAQGQDHPVTCITFEDAAAYAAWLTAKTGHTWRLPTEAEFEFFNRSGHSGRFGVDVGSVTDLCARANGADRSSGWSYANTCDDGFAATAPVGSFPPNAFGLFDTTGNVWELTSDCVGRVFVRVLKDRLRLAPSDASSSGNTDCPGRHVVRGGAFLSSPGNLEAGYHRLEGYRANRTGFRVVRELP